MDTNRTMHFYDYQKDCRDSDILVDLREPFLFRFGSIPGAINIPLDQIGRLYQLPKSARIIIFCQAGEISAEITTLLLDAGYDAYHLAGGYREYLRHQFAEHQNKP